MADEKETKENKEEEKEAESKDSDEKEEPKEGAEAESKDADVDEEGEDVEVPAEFKEMIEKIENMTVLELNQLVKVIEKKFGVSAQAVAVAGAGAGDGGAAEEKDEFTVELASAGDSKIGVIKAVKSALGLGLKEAKDLVEDAPAVLKENVKKEEAEEMKAAIEEAGGKVELK